MNTQTTPREFALRRRSLRQNVPVSLGSGSQSIIRTPSRVSKYTDQVQPLSRRQSHRASMIIAEALHQQANHVDGVFAKGQPAATVTTTPSSLLRKRRRSMLANLPSLIPPTLSTPFNSQSTKRNFLASLQNAPPSLNYFSQNSLQNTPASLDRNPLSLSQVVPASLNTGTGNQSNFSSQKPNPIPTFQNNHPSVHPNPAPSLQSGPSNTNSNIPSNYHLQGLNSGSRHGAIQFGSLLGPSAFNTSSPANSPLLSDPRPLRDKTYQLLIMQEIMDFLVTNQFERETGYSITAKNLARPTQKDFVLMYRFLYSRLDPNYVFERAIDVDVLTTLKLIEYPYLDSLNRSQISAVGGHHWPTFLGVLYFLVTQNLLYALSKKECDNILHAQDPIDVIGNNFSTESYAAYLTGADEFSEETSRMKQEFQRLFHDILTAQAAASAESEAIEARTITVERELLQAKEALKMSMALENDVKSLGEYVRDMQDRKPRWHETLEKLESNLNTTERELVHVQEAQAQVERDLAARETSLVDIDRLLSKKSKLELDLQTMNAAVLAKATLTAQHEQVLQGHNAELINCKDQYNQKILSLSSDIDHLVHDNILSRMGHEELYRVELKKINSSESNFREYLGGELVEPPFSIILGQKDKLRKELATKRTELQESTALLNTDLAAGTEELTRIDTEIHHIKTRLVQVEQERDDIVQLMHNDSMAYSKLIDDYQRQIRASNTRGNEAFIEIESRYIDSLTVHQERMSELERRKILMYKKCEEIFGFAIDIKMQLQTSLNNTADVIAAELDIITQSEPVDAA